MTKFRTTILSAGKTAAGMVVPPAVVASLGTSKKPKVKVTIKEGNDLSAVTKGGTSARTQASVLELYDQNRIKSPGKINKNAVNNNYMHQ